MDNSFSFDFLKELDDNKSEIKTFLTSCDKNYLDDKIKLLTSFLGYLRGYYSQILVRVQDYLSKEEFNNYLNLQEHFIKEIASLTSLPNTIDKLNDLNKLYDELNDAYNNLNNKIITVIDTDNPIPIYNNLIKKANDIIFSLNNIELSKSHIESLLPIYNSISTPKDIDKLNTFISMGYEILSNIDKDTINNKLGKTDERIFSLFAKINDQIIDSYFLTKDNLVYALYKLEDNSNYYAIIKNEQEIEILNQSIMSLPNLVLTKDNIINTCKIIIKNAGIYYDINEYMRYIEKSYKGKMTKEIDEVILKYKTRLEEIENLILGQLSFIDEIALLVNHKPCSKYPNIIYNDVDIKEYFPVEELDMDTLELEKEKLIVNILLNCNVKSEFDTKNILKTLYDTNTLKTLLTSNYSKSEETPDVNVNDIIAITNELENTNTIKTNYDKIDDYLNMRIEELKLLESSPKINVTITKDENNIFKDINTVLDLSTAIAICNKVYQKGQGEYAVIDYLKTGNTLKFTSKYKARDLASSVNRDSYMKLLIENILKKYVYANDYKEFVENILNSNISVLDITKKILDDDNLLIDSTTKFDFDYLYSNSQKRRVVDEKLNGESSGGLIKINKIIDDIKKINKIID